MKNIEEIILIFVLLLMTCWMYWRLSVQRTAWAWSSPAWCYSGGTGDRSSAPGGGSPSERPASRSNRELLLSSSYNKIITAPSIPILRHLIHVQFTKLVNWLSCSVKAWSAGSPGASSAGSTLSDFQTSIIQMTVMLLISTFLPPVSSHFHLLLNLPSRGKEVHQLNRDLLWSDELSFLRDPVYQIMSSFIL